MSVADIAFVSWIISSGVSGIRRAITQKISDHPKLLTTPKRLKAWSSSRLGGNVY